MMIRYDTIGVAHHRKKRNYLCSMPTASANIRQIYLYMLNPYGILNKFKPYVPKTVVNFDNIVCVILLPLIRVTF